MDNYSLYKLDNHESKFVFGGKGNGILKLIHAGIAVPETHALPAEVTSLEQLFKLSNLRAPVSFPLIVRSSADQEDQTDAAWAGAFKSLKVDSPSDWIPAVKEVLRSILLSATKHDLPLKAGLIVQPWIKTLKRGVAFSRLPNDLWPKVVLIEWAEGGSTVVEGESHTNLIRSDDSNLPNWVKPIIDLTHALESKFRTPVDIEWGIDHNNELIIFQCRPISGSVANQLRRVLEDPTKTWSRDLAEERFPSCLTPMGWDVIEDGIPVNLKALLDYFGLQASTPRDLAFSDEGWIYNSREFFKFPDGLKFRVFSFFKRRPLFLIKSLLLVRRLFSKHRKEEFVAGLVENVMEPLLPQIDRDLKSALALVPLLREKLESGRRLTDVGSVEREFRELTELGKIFFKADLPVFLAKDSLFKAYQRLWVKEYAESFLNKLTPLPENISLAISTQPDDLLFARRTWDVYYRASDDLREHIQACVRPLESVNSDLDPKWRLRVQNLQRWMMWDEELHHYTGLFLEVTRNLLLSCGELMVEQGVLKQSEDIFFLRLNEAKLFLKNPQAGLKHFKSKADSRRRRWILRSSQIPIRSFPPSSVECEDKISHAGMAPGIAKAPALFLDEQSDLSKVPVGPFVLVTRTANPVWIPLFGKAVAWVTAVGGPLSHGFIAAREWGLPAVSGYPIDNLKNLSSDKIVTVDGTRGEVSW